MKGGICGPVSIYAINLLAFACALAILYKLLRLSGVGVFYSWLCLLVMQMSTTVQLLLILPQTDILLLPFFWGTILCCTNFERMSTRAKWRWGVGALSCAAVAITIRTAAIPLVAVILVAFSGLRESLFKKSVIWLLGGGLFLLAIGMLLAFRFTDFAASGGYFSSQVTFYREAGILGCLSIVWGHLHEIAQLVCNKIPESIYGVGTCATLVVVMFFIMALVSQWRSMSFSMLVAVLSYGALILIWYCHDPRFMLPILPFILIIIGKTVAQFEDKLKVVRIVKWGYLFGFVAVGLLFRMYLARQWINFDGPIYLNTLSEEMRKTFVLAQTKNVNGLVGDERNRNVFLLKMFDPRHCTPEAAPLQLHDWHSFVDTGVIGLTAK